MWQDTIVSLWHRSDFYLELRYNYRLFKDSPRKSRRLLPLRFFVSITSFSSAIQDLPEYFWHMEVKPSNFYNRMGLLCIRSGVGESAFLRLRGCFTLVRGYMSEITRWQILWVSWAALVALTIHALHTSAASKRLTRLMFVKCFPEGALLYRLKWDWYRAMMWKAVNLLRRNRLCIEACPDVVFSELMHSRQFNSGSGYVVHSQ